MSFVNALHHNPGLTSLIEGVVFALYTVELTNLTWSHHLFPLRLAHLKLSNLSSLSFHSSLGEEAEIGLPTHPSFNMAWRSASFRSITTLHLGRILFSKLTSFTGLVSSFPFLQHLYVRAARVELRTTLPYIPAAAQANHRKPRLKTLEVDFHTNSMLEFVALEWMVHSGMTESLEHVQFKDVFRTTKPEYTDPRRQALSHFLEAGLSFYHIYLSSIAPYDINLRSCSGLRTIIIHWITLEGAITSLSSITSTSVSMIDMQITYANEQEADSAFDGWGRLDRILTSHPFMPLHLNMVKISYRLPRGKPLPVTDTIRREFLELDRALGPKLAIDIGWD